MTKVEFIAREFLERGGKKLRPRLCKAVYSSLGGSADIDSICEAIECFHKASLIHDDIQDCDEERYGKPTLWKEYGVAMAIAAGDWLVAHGYDLIAGSGFEKVPEMLIASSRSHKRLSEGQGDDLVYLGKYPTVEERVSVYERKTGEAFALAAQLGALAAGADDEKYRKYGLTFGVYFQIMDDLSDGEVPSSEIMELKKKYEDETAICSDECALGVW